MGLPSVYTHHSLFGYSDMASINLNKVEKVFLTEANACTTVSHICKQGLCLAASLHPNDVHALPNGLDCTIFRPDPTKRYP